MDGHSNLSEIGHSQRNDDAIRHLGLTLVKVLKPLLMSPEELDFWWECARTQDYYFSDFERNRKDIWLSRFLNMNNLHLGTEDYGYCTLVNAWLNDTPELHFCVWDSERSRQRTMDIGAEILALVFREFRAARVTGLIPEFNKAALSFATLNGFKFEGCMRQAFRYFGKPWDLHVYGLLKSEWEQRSRRLNNGR
jgi:RimJ/RimL family protein N-acetyltransferase